ncbi:MAG TPA: glycerol-3-phosphate 1-O-acyltransferase PlsY [Candidatus Omnitrophota bacterium]|nr:glycerol-3-phosphate 1-O-acyltransferase PlsY [Candidatus Omnitrophota bacterium]
MALAFLSVLLAYLLGSLPTAYIFGKFLRGIDIRQHGSGNVGATNVLRVIGKGPGIAVFVIDCAKGFAAVAVLPELINKIFPGQLSGGDVFRLSLAGAVIAGHIWTCFLSFKGGKGVATTAGAMLGLYPAVFISGLIVWIMVFYLWKYVSLASIAAAVSLPVFSILTNESLTTTAFMAALSLLAIYSHRDNVKRLIQGTEARFVKMKKM